MRPERKKKRGDTREKKKGEENMRTLHMGGKEGKGGTIHPKKGCPEREREESPFILLPKIWERKGGPLCPKIDGGGGRGLHQNKKGRKTKKRKKAVHPSFFMTIREPGEKEKKGGRNCSLKKKKGMTDARKGGGGGERGRSYFSFPSTEKGEKSANQ